MSNVNWTLIDVAMIINLINIDTYLKAVRMRIARDMRIITESGLIPHYHILHGTSLFSTLQRHPEATSFLTWWRTDTYLGSDCGPDMPDPRDFFRATDTGKNRELEVKMTFWHSLWNLPTFSPELYHRRNMTIKLKPVKLVGKFTSPISRYLAYVLI